MTIEPNRYNILKEHNYELKEQVDNLRQDLQNRCDRCIELNNEKRYWLDNFKRLRDDKVNLIDENAQLKHEIDKQKNYNMSHAQRISELKKQNEKLYKPHEVFKFKEQIERLRIDKYKYIELYKQKLDEVIQLKQRISKLVSENTTLQNDLFSEQLIQDEAEDYINQLQQELLRD